MRHVPNLLAVLRLLLAPLAVWAIVAGEYRTALALFGIAAASDAIDGPLARRYHCVSRLGAYLDPIADKALLSAGYVALGVAQMVPWWLVGLVFGRDLMILALVGLALLFTNRRDFPPSGWGKLSTIVQAGAGTLLIAGRAFPALAAPAAPLIWVVAAATLWSGLVYLARAMRLRP